MKHQVHPQLDGCEHHIDRAAKGRSAEGTQPRRSRSQDISAAAALKLASRASSCATSSKDGPRQDPRAPERVRSARSSNFYEVRDLTPKLTSFPGIDIKPQAPPAPGKTPEVPKRRAATRTDHRADRSSRGSQHGRQASWERNTNTIVDKAGTLSSKQTPENKRAIVDLLTASASRRASK